MSTDDKKFDFDDLIDPGRELRETIFARIREIETSILERRLQRLERAFLDELEDNTYRAVEEPALERVRGLLSGYVFDERSLARLTYGQILVLDRYWALFNLLGDAAVCIGSHTPARADRSDDLLAAVT